MTSSMSSRASSRPSSEVQPVLRLGPAVRAPPADDLEPVVDVDLDQLAQPEGARLPVDEADVVDAERLLHRREAEQLLENGLRMEAVLDLDDQTQSLAAVGEVRDVGDAAELLGAHQVRDLLDDALGPDRVRQLGDHDAATPGREVLDPGRWPGCGRCPGPVSYASRMPSRPTILPPVGRSGPGTKRMRSSRVALGWRQQVPCGRDDLTEVVRRHVGRHADRDAARAVDQQVGQCRGEDLGLGADPVVGRAEVGHVLVEAFGHQHRGLREAGLGVAHRRRRVVVAERAEVAVPVDQRDAHRERLGHPNQGVVDGAVTVRVEVTHDVTHDA